MVFLPSLAGFLELWPSSKVEMYDKDTLGLTSARRALKSHFSASAIVDMPVVQSILTCVQANGTEGRRHTIARLLENFVLNARFHRLLRTSQPKTRLLSTVPPWLVDRHTVKGKCAAAIKCGEWEGGGIWPVHGEFDVLTIIGMKTNRASKW